MGLEGLEALGVGELPEVAISGGQLLGAAPHQLDHALLDVELRSSVHGAGGLVQYEQCRRCEDSTEASPGSRMMAVARPPMAKMGAFAEMRITPLTKVCTWVTSLV